jgi:hypothetical protein
MAITTDKKAQSAIIKYYSVSLQAQNINIIKSSRGGQHLRINYQGDPAALLNKILPCTLKASDVNISGSYTTYELEIKKAIPDAKVKDKIYFVNAVSSKGVLKTKELTPAKLNLTGDKISKTNFPTNVKAAVKKLSHPENIKSFLIELFEASSTTTGLIKSKHIEAITDTDINIIAKDFGEVTGAWWWMNVHKKTTTAVEYPPEENQPLVDYYTYVGKVKTAVSAKANEGAPPSINAIADILRPMKYTETKKEAARKAIIAISDASTVDGIVEASRQLNTPGYAWIKKNMFGGKDFSADYCEAVMSKFASPKQVMDKLKPLYDIMGRSASLEIVTRIFGTHAKRYGILISPLGYHLVDQLNNNPVYLSVLNDAAKTIVVSQIYMKINKSSKTVSYTVKEFAASAFKFEYNANAGQPSLKKISFKMDKKKP